jgi:imidazolonepropionase-like amidohydrolase
MVRKVLGLVPFLLGSFLAVTAASGSVTADDGKTSPSLKRTASVTILAGQLVRPSGKLERDVAVIVRDGKIRRVCTAGEVRGQSARKFGAGTVVCPGLIDLFSPVGTFGQLGETVSLIDPDASPADSIDPGHADFRNALRSGVTTVMVAPIPNNLVSGVCLSVRTFVDGEGLDVLRDDGPLVFALREGVWRQDRPPTSRAGAVQAFRTLIAEAQLGNAHPRINAAVSGQLDSVIVCQSSHDVAGARGVLGDRIRRFSLMHTTDAIDIATELKSMRRPVVVGPYTFVSSRRVLLGAAALADAGTEVAFRAGFPESAPDGLRITAALAVRHGMDPADARRAVTAVPAKVAGVNDRVGIIAPGKDADLVVFSGDPLRLDAKVLEVYVRGVRVYCAEYQEKLQAGGCP